jgi:hypothetical protein
VAFIFAEDGTPLADVSIDLTSVNRVAIRRVRKGKDLLLNYYFGQGRGRVSVVEAGETALGSLRTYWRGHQRHWEVLVREWLRAGDPLSGAMATSIVEADALDAAPLTRA